MTINRLILEQAITDEITSAAIAGDTNARYWDWSGPSDEKSFFPLIIAALTKLGITVVDGF